MDKFYLKYNFFLQGGDSRYSRQIFKDITSNPDNELEAKTKKGESFLSHEEQSQVGYHM